MCGIALIASVQTLVSEGAIEQMTECLQHRGPDAQKYVKLPNCHLGHTRLSIIDLAGGAQPMTEETQRYWIVFNGEIYNYRELRQELEILGWSFRTQSDTEVLLRAFQQYGENTPALLNGQFAFAIWDQTEHRLFVARDRFGEKPLFWAISSQGELLIASELKALLSSGLLQPQLDESSVEAYLTLLYVPPDRTIYKNILTVSPSHCLTWQGSKLNQWCYWRPDYSCNKLEIGEATEKIHHLVSQAVRRQMVADVPVGAFLSGGLDSSTIVALMSRHTGHKVKTFSVGFGDLINELPYAKAVAQLYQADHTELQVDIPVSDVLEKLIDVYDEPFADSSNVPTYLMSELTSQHVKVVLSGDGGDELFGGYEWYKILLDSQNKSIGQNSQILLRTEALVWRLLAKALFWNSQYQKAVSKKYTVTNLKCHYSDLWQRHLAASTYLECARSALWEKKQAFSSLSLLRSFEPSIEINQIDRATYFDINCYLSGDILVKVDRATMAHGLESRTPFLDADLAEFMLSLPWQLRFQNGNDKGLLKQAFQDLWPKEIQKRKKQGFGAPIWRWIQRPDILRLVSRVLHSQSALVELLPGVRNTFSTLSCQEQWTLLCLGLWLERHSECL